VCARFREGEKESRPTLEFQGLTHHGFLFEKVTVPIETLHVASIDTKKGRGRKFVCCTSIEVHSLSVEEMEYITKMPKQTSDNIQALLKVLILATIAGAAISSRLFSVIRYSPPSSSTNFSFESIIHEFDPYYLLSLSEFDWCVDGSTFERQNIWSTLPSSHFGIGSILDHGILSAESLEEPCIQVSW
jgi:hypothetical protein